jgi:integrase
VTSVKFIPKTGKGVRRERGSGTVTLRAEKDQRGNPVPARYYVASGVPFFRWLYRSPSGGSKLLLAKSRQHAEELARDWERDRPAVKVERGTFAALAGDFLQWKEGQVSTGSVSARTVAWYGERLDQHILPTLGAKQAAAITPTDVSELLARVNLGPRSNNALVTLLGGIFEYAVELDRLPRNPVRPKVHRKKEKETDRLRRQALQEAMPTEQQVRDFMDHALRREDGTSAGAALALAMETGLRREELLHLRREDVTVTATLADVRVATDFACSCRTCRKDGGRHRTKNRHTRYVPLSKRAEKIVREQLARLDREAIGGPWLFPVLRHAPYARVGAGSQMHHAHLSGAMETLTTGAGIGLPKGVMIHFTRHVALSRWEVAGLTQGQRDLASGHDAAGVRAAYSHGDRQALFAAFRERL